MKVNKKILEYNFTHRQDGASRAVLKQFSIRSNKAAKLLGTMSQLMFGNSYIITN
jgi:hypothetical protein